MVDFENGDKEIKNPYMDSNPKINLFFDGFSFGLGWFEDDINIFSPFSLSTQEDHEPSYFTDSRVKPLFEVGTKLFLSLEGIEVVFLCSKNEIESIVLMKNHKPFSGQMLTS
jgi:hypothetical protein